MSDDWDRFLEMESNAIIAFQKATVALSKKATARNRRKSAKAKAELLGLMKTGGASYTIESLIK